MTLEPHGAPELERLLRVKIIIPPGIAIPAPRPGHWHAFADDVIEVIEPIAQALIQHGEAELVSADTPLKESI